MNRRLTAALAAIILRLEARRASARAIVHERPAYMSGWELSEEGCEGRLLLTSTRLPRPDCDGRAFLVLVYTCAGGTKTVGYYSVEDGGFLSEDGVLMDVTHYWSKPLVPAPTA